MAGIESKVFEHPDEVRTPPNSKVEVIRVGGGEVMRITFEPGWKWSEHIKPGAGTDLCQMHHRVIQLAGRMHVKMSDGTEADTGPNEVADIPPGHDAWVVGDEPVVLIDFGGGTSYGKS